MTDGYHEADEGLLLAEWELRDLKERWREIASLTHRLEQAIRERDELQAKLDAELPAAWREDLVSLNECLERVSRERDELKARLAHAEADAEQAVHNAAFTERQRIIKYIRVRLAHATMDDRVSIRERGVMIDLANAIENGEHE